jgi:hypothetical protein
MPTDSIPTESRRLVSLDVFRGLTIAGMVLVNNPGTWEHIYWPLEHAQWSGWTPTDLCLPVLCFHRRRIHPTRFCQSSRKQRQQARSLSEDHQTDADHLRDWSVSERASLFWAG